MSLNGSAGERLREMGLLPGAPIRLVRRAPLGCPLEFEVAGARLAIRGRDAARIFTQ
jgi:Fe2+ transport system protein FeoA